MRVLLENPGYATEEKKYHISSINSFQYFCIYSYKRFQTLNDSNNYISTYCGLAGLEVVEFNYKLDVKKYKFIEFES